MGKSYLDSRARLGFPMAPKQHADEVLAETGQSRRKTKKSRLIFPGNKFAI